MLDCPHLELPLNLSEEEDSKMIQRELFLYNSQKLKLFSKIKQESTHSMGNQDSKLLTKVNKFFIEDEQKLISKFDQEKQKETLKNQHINDIDFNQIDDDEPERSSDDELAGPKFSYIIILSALF